MNELFKFQPTEEQKVCKKIYEIRSLAVGADGVTADVFVVLFFLKSYVT